MNGRLLSWGRYPRLPQQAHPVHWPDDIASSANAAAASGRGTLAYGMGRSYGDSCLAASDHVVSTQAMDRMLAADWSMGIVRAQSGMTLDTLIRIALPRGWFPPVTPGTRYVTLGGAVANDVHGKNHHVHGTFGRHLRGLALWRSDSGTHHCSLEHDSDLFRATVGGLGLTGIVLEVELQLRRVYSSDLQQTSIRFGSLDEFFALSRQLDSQHEYSVAWIDCLATGRHTGRGIYYLADHCTDGPLECAPDGRLAMPMDPPLSLVNKLTLHAFNTLYYHGHRRGQASSRVGYAPYFYPLDSIRHWNRLYGRQGFQQYQCVVPSATGQAVMHAVMKEIARSGTGSFLAVLKQCGDLDSPGLLSFPMPGLSLALDFPQHDARNATLFARLDALVHEAGGRLYPAKDAHMSAEHFQRAYPAWSRVEAMRDPQLLSRFWKRVTA